MNKQEFKISNLELAFWMNAIRNLDSHDDRTRALDALWMGQLSSKGWLVNNLIDYVASDIPVNIYIFGGWIGILGSMLLQTDKLTIGKIRSIDIDPWCESIADTVNKRFEMDDWRFKARTADMSTYDYEWNIDPNIVINTSSEHVTQLVYDTWYNKIPNGSFIVVQGNNFFNCNEHIRCSHNLNEFNDMNHVNNPLFTGELKTDMYIRYMSLWIKK